MTKKILTISITLFWLIMMGLLIRNEILPKYFGIKAISYREMLPKHLLLQDEWMGIYFNNAKIGYSNTYMTVKEKDAVSGYAIQNETNLFLPLLGSLHKVYFKSATFVNSEGQLIDFDFLLKSEKNSTQVIGTKINDRTLKLDVASSGIKSQSFIPLPRQSVLYNPLLPFGGFGKIHKGEKFLIDFFNPISLTNEKVKLLVKDKVRIKSFGQDTDAYLISIDYRGLETYAWVSSQGRLLKQTSSLGWTIISESPQEAISNINISPQEQIDLLNIYSVGANLIIPNPEKTKLLKLKITGINSLKDLQDYRQRLIREKNTDFLVISKNEIPRDKILSLPINTKDMEGYLESSDFIQSKDRKIIQQAKKIVGPETNALKAAILLNNWLYKNIKKFPTISIPSSTEVLHTMEGDCNEHTYLFVALARALGIPAKVLVGLVYRDNRFFYHAWPAVFVGEWLSMDPTFGQDNADATHIRLFEGELNQQLNLASILGKVKIHIEEYR